MTVRHRRQNGIELFLYYLFQPHVFLLGFSRSPKQSLESRIVRHDINALGSSKGHQQHWPNQRKKNRRQEEGIEVKDAEASQERARPACLRIYGQEGEGEGEGGD
jgi:hypothetical protein